MSIPSVVLDLWQFSFVRDLPEIRKLEISPSEFCPISGNWSELETANLVWMFLMKCYWNARCQWNGCYRFSVFSNKKIFLFIFWIATSKKPLSIVKTSARKFESMVYTPFFSGIFGYLESCFNFWSWILSQASISVEFLSCLNYAEVKRFTPVFTAIN